jgi:hypothetical protein
MPVKVTAGWATGLLVSTSPRADWTTQASVAVAILTCAWAAGAKPSDG